MLCADVRPSYKEDLEVVVVELLCSVEALAHKEHNSWERPSHLIKMMPCSPDIAVELTRHCSGFSVQTMQLHVINQ